MFENVIYPVEIIDVMVKVASGTYEGDNPELVIDQMLGDFYYTISDKRRWATSIGQAVKQLGCLDCILARLNLECLLEAHVGDGITIRFDRQRLLPGENHGVGCGCRACQYKQLEYLINDKRSVKVEDNQDQDQNLDEVISYPDKQEALDELEATFYAQEQEIKRDLPKPSLDPERKAEILDILRQCGYQVVDTREKAFVRLEKLLKRRSPEQNIIGRLAYLLIFMAFKSLDSRRFLNTILPRGLLGNL